MDHLIAALLQGLYFRCGAGERRIASLRSFSSKRDASRIILA